MRCSKAQRLINDHVDSLLKTRQIRSLESHTQKCANCRDLLIDMESILNNAKELEIFQPSDDLWSAIKEQATQKDRKTNTHISWKSLFPETSRYPRGLSYGLRAIIAVIILAPLLYYSLPYMQNTRNNPEEIAMDHFRLAEQHYQSAIEALDRAIEALDEELSPELAVVFEKNLEIIDESIQVCKSAIDESPESPEANKLLLICYRKKIELLNEIKDINMHTG